MGVGRYFFLKRLQSLVVRNIFSVVMCRGELEKSQKFDRAIFCKKMERFFIERFFIEVYEYGFSSGLLYGVHGGKSVIFTGNLIYSFGVLKLKGCSDVQKFFLGKRVLGFFCIFYLYLHWARIRGVSLGVYH